MNVYKRKNEMEDDETIAGVVYGVYAETVIKTEFAKREDNYSYQPAVIGYIVTAKTTDPIPARDKDVVPMDTEDCSPSLIDSEYCVTHTQLFPCDGVPVKERSENHDLHMSDEELEKKMLKFVNEWWTAKKRTTKKRGSFLAELF